MRALPQRLYESALIDEESALIAGRRQDK